MKSSKYFKTLSLFGLISFLHFPSAHADTYVVPDSAGTIDVDLETDASGGVHAIVATDLPDGASALNYALFQGGSWREGASVENAQTGQLYGLDLAVGPDQTIHLCYYNDQDLRYASLPPNSEIWTQETIATEIGFPSGSNRDRSRASLVMKGSIPNVVFVENGNGGVSQLGYATRVNGVWNRESIAPAASVLNQNPNPYSGSLPMLSNEAIPKTEDSATPGITPQGLTLCYHHDGEYRLIERIAVTDLGGISFGWSNPETIGTGPATPGRANFQIQDDVLHFLYIGDEPESSLTRQLYFRREKVDTDSGVTLSSTYESFYDCPPDESCFVAALSLAIAADQSPLISYRVSSGAPWFQAQARRITQGTWEPIILAEPEDPFPGLPTLSSLALDVFGRPFQISTRNGAGSFQSSQVDFDLTFPKSAQEFPLLVNRRVDRLVTPDFAVGPYGHVALVHNVNGGAIVEARNTLTGERHFTSLDLAIPSGESQVSIGSLLIASAGGDAFWVATQTRSNRSEPGALTTNKILLHKYLFGQVAPESYLISEKFSDLASESILQLASDRGIAYLAEFATDLTSEATLHLRDRSGQPIMNSLVSEFTQQIPGALRGIQLEVSRGGLGVIAYDAAAKVRLFYRNALGEWRDGALKQFTQIAEVTQDYSIAVNGESYLASYIGSANDLRLVDGATASPVAGSEFLDSLFFGSNPVGFQSRISYGVETRIHLVTRFLGGAAEGAIEESVFNGFPTSEGSNRLSKTRRFTQTDTTLLKTDSFGEPAILTYSIDPDQTGNRICLSQMTIDADRDGLPLFAEFAFARDPFQPESQPLLTMMVEPDDSQGGAPFYRTTLSFDRPGGPGNVTPIGIDVGQFSYIIETSRDLKMFRSPSPDLLRQIPDLTTDEPGLIGGLQQNVEYKWGFSLDGPVPNPKSFFRIKASYR